MSLIDHYRHELRRLGYSPDPVQTAAVARLDDLQRRLKASVRPQNPLRRLLQRPFQRRNGATPPRGLYLWGGVGRGKTWLMDMFYDTLPLQQKQRSHFHRFMQALHEELKRYSEHADPLQLVAERLAAEIRVLCFDELFVSDIADAMLLGQLLQALFERRVTLVATSNVAPDDLYKDGLQRVRFLPAIAQLKEHTEVLHVDGGTDYRLRVLTQAHTWFAAGPQSERALLNMFVAIAGNPGADSPLTVNHRLLHPERHAGGAVWFSFRELCEGPRSQEDYIELARCFHTVFLTDIPRLTAEDDNAVRRLISLVDEFYDRGVKLIISAAVPADQLYDGSRLLFEFGRTRSRLTEMQSQEYLAREHRG